MTTRSNLHTHSVFCDGDNTIEEMTLRALELGFESLGFSSHAFCGYPFDECGIKEERIDEYFLEIDRMKGKYGDRITLFKGFELESRVLGEGRPSIDPRCDYTIGSCHLFRKDGKFFSVDNTEEEWLQAKEAFGNNTMELLESYYEEMASFAEECPFDIVGHIDLPTKFNEGKDGPLFEETEEYQAMALHYIDRIIRTGKIFEVNTGAISRRRRTSPYPSTFILTHLLEKKAPITISSDVHNAKYMDCFFPEAEKLLKDLGFREQMKLTEKGFVPVAL